MSNKSINTKGLSRQLEDKANKLQDDLSELRDKHTQLQERFDDKMREAKRLEEEIYDLGQDADVRDQRLKDQNELLRNEHESTLRKCESLTAQMQQDVKDLQSKSEEKDLLHSRHDALTAESQTLQKDLTKASNRVLELEGSLREERQHAEDNDRQLRSEARDEINRLSEEVDNLRRELDDKESQFAADQDHWKSQRRNLQTQKGKAEEQANGLQRTINKLQETEGTLSGQEMKLQQALESEKQRHQSEEAILQRQIRDLGTDIEQKRQALDDLRSDLSQSKEDLRVSQSDLGTLEEKVQALEDEVDVLQTGLDEEAEKAREDIIAAGLEAERLQSQLSAAKEQLEFGWADQHDKGRESHFEEMTSRLRAAEENLRQVRNEKQLLQDKLATNNLELHKLQSAAVETQAERHGFESHLKPTQGQVDENFKADQERTNLRTSNLKLENEANRLHEERKSLLEKIEIVERELQEEMARASSEAGRLSDEIADLQRKLNYASGNREREVTAEKQRVQRLEARVNELESSSQRNEDREELAAELSMAQKDLSATRKREKDYVQREQSHRDSLRDLKQKIGRLERQTHEAEIARLDADSPKSSVGGSVRKNELVELQRQVADAHQQLKDARTKSRDDVDSLRRRLANSEQQIQVNIDSYEQQQEQLETDLSATRHEHENLLAKNATANQTINRLRIRISSLEQDLRNHRQTATSDTTIAEERKDLHEMLKDAKIQAEDLQVEITSRETSLAAASTREKEYRAQLKRVREERTLQTQKSSALSAELESLQSRYERAVDNLSHKQRSWEAERKAMVSRVRFANTSMSSLHGNEKLELVIKENEKRHFGELKGLAKQIQWLRAKCQREEGFRLGLIYEKKYLTMQIGMFEAWYVLFSAHTFMYPNLTSPQQFYRLEIAVRNGCYDQLPRSFHKASIRRCFERQTGQVASTEETHSESARFGGDSGVSNEADGSRLGWTEESKGGTTKEDGGNGGRKGKEDELEVGCGIMSAEYCTAAWKGVLVPLEIGLHGTSIISLVETLDRFLAPDAAPWF